MDDIFKLHYEKELGHREIKLLFKRFASIQNRILIDYKKVREYLNRRMVEIGEAERGIRQFLQENEIAGSSRQDEMASNKAKSVCSKSSYIADRMSQISSASMMHRRKFS